MKLEALTPKEYLELIPENQRESFSHLREIILENIPSGFIEEMSYGMIGYIVPLNIYSNGYHCNPKLPLPFLNIAAQKNFFALYHMGIYASPELRNWFIKEYAKHSKLKLNMGKSCIRFKNYSQIPYALIAELVRKMDVNDWIKLYESQLKNN